MQKLILSLLSAALVFSVAAQSNMNWKGLADTSKVNTWRADSLFISRPFNFSNAENKLICVVVDDSGSAGRKADSVKAEVGISLGTQMAKLEGGYDTAWTNIIPIDTLSLLDTTKMYNGTTLKGGVKWTLSSDDLTTRPRGAIDTSFGASSSVMWIGLNAPYWSPLIRVTLKGLTGNNVSGFVRAHVALVQRGSSYVRLF